MRLSKIISITILCSVLFFSGCNLFPPPEDTIGPPRREGDVSADNTDIINVIRGFINADDKLMNLDEKDKSKCYYLMDIDGDKKEEVITQYEHINSFPEYRLLVLKKGDKNWTKLYEEDFYFKESIKSIDFKDLTGDNIPEVFVMYKDNYLVIYRYYEAMEKKFVSTLSSRCTGYKIDDIEGKNGKDGMLELYSINDNPNEFRAFVYRWNGISFSYVIEEYLESFVEPVTSLAKKLASDPDNYRLADDVMESQLRFGMYEDALKTAEMGLFSLKNIEYKNRFLGVKARALLALGKYNEARAAAEDAIKAGEELMEYVKKGSKQSVIAPGSYYDIIADSYVFEKEYNKAKEIIKINTKLPYAEAAQEIDALIARDSILDYIKNSNSTSSKDLIMDIVRWGGDNNIVINCVEPENYEGIFSHIYIIDFHLNPSVAFGKESVGGHIICWNRDGIINYTYFPAINDMNSMPLIGDLLASNAKVFTEKEQMKLGVSYKNTGSGNYLPEAYTQYFLYENNNFKLGYK